MSSKSKRISGGSNTYSASRKRHIRDLSVSSQDEPTNNNNNPSDIEKNKIENHEKLTNNSKQQEQEQDKEQEKDKGVEVVQPEGKNDKGEEEDDDDDDEEEEDKEYEVETIKDHRYQGKTLHFLVGWKGYSSDDDSWEPAKHLTGALELLKQYKTKHNLDSKPKNGRASNVSARSTNSKKIKGQSEKEKENNEESVTESIIEPDQEQENNHNHNDGSSSRKRKRKSQQQDNKTKSKKTSTIAPLRKNGINGPTKADRDSVANRKKNLQPDSDASGDEAESVDDDEWLGRHIKLDSWEHLIRSIRNIEKQEEKEAERQQQQQQQQDDDDDEDDENNSARGSNSNHQTIQVCLLWNTGRTSWVSNKIARAKVPQKLLDFYEAHLQFSSTEN